MVPLGLWIISKDLSTVKCSIYKTHEYNIEKSLIVFYIINHTLLCASDEPWVTQPRAHPLLAILR